MRYLVIILFMITNIICLAKPVLWLNRPLSDEQNVIYTNERFINLGKGLNKIILENVPSSIDTKSISVNIDSAAVIQKNAVLKKISSLGNDIAHFQNYPWLIRLSDNSQVAGTITDISDSTLVLISKTKQELIHLKDIQSITDRYNQNFDLFSNILILSIDSFHEQQSIIKFEYIFEDLSYLTTYQGILNKNTYKLSGFQTVRNYSGKAFANCLLVYNENSMFNESNTKKPNYFEIMEVNKEKKHEFESDVFILMDSLGIANNEEIRLPYIERIAHKVTKSIYFDFTNDLRYAVQIPEDFLTAGQNHIFPGMLNNYEIDELGQLRYMSEHHLSSKPKDYGPSACELIDFGIPFNISRECTYGKGSEKKVVFTNNNDYDVEIFFESREYSPLNQIAGLTEVLTKGEGDDCKIRYRYLLKNKESATFETK